MTTEFKSFHGKKEIKELYLKRLKVHAKADEIIKGTYWENGKGCAVGCTIEGRKNDESYHKTYEVELGLPEWLAILEDRIFEGLPNKEAKKFPIAFLKAINVGSNLNMVKPKFLLWVFEDINPKIYENYPKVKDAINNVIKLLNKQISGQEVKTEEWKEARYAAANAAAYAADAAADAAGAHPNTLSRQRIATLSGFSVNGGTFNTYISELKRNNWIQQSGEELRITDEGLSNASAQEIPSGEELLSLWMGKFRQGASQILKYVYEQYPNEITKEEIGQATGFEPSGGTFNTYLSELKRNGLIETTDVGIKISEEFFQ